MASVTSVRPDREDVDVSRTWDLESIFATGEDWEAAFATAERELEAQGEFTRVVVNDRLEDAVDELESIVRSAI